MDSVTHSRRSTCLLSLPDELLEKIVNYLVNCQKERRLGAGIAQTCRRLSNIATPLIWTNFTILHAESLLFRKYFRTGTQCLPYMRSLTIKLDPSQRHVHARFGTIFGEFARMLGAVQGLGTLSIKVGHCTPGTREVQCNELCDYLSTENEMINLLAAIPTSVTALDLDITQPDPIHDRYCTGFCTTLSGLVQRLEHLRIHQWLCCPGMLRNSNLTAPNLKSFVIQIHHLGWRDPGNYLSAVYQSRLAIAAGDSYKRGVFPVIEKLLVVGHHITQSAELLDDDADLLIPAASKIDIIRNRTTIIPYERLKGNKWWARFPSTDLDDENGNGYFDNDNGEQFWQCVEEEAWVETAIGAKRPNTEGSHDARSRFIPTSRWKMNEEHAPVSIEVDGLWRGEMRARRALVKPRISEGLKDLRPLLRAFN